MTLSDDQDIVAAAGLLGLHVPEACRAGIAQNLKLLRDHFAVLEAMPAEGDRPE